MRGSAADKKEKVKRRISIRVKWLVFICLSVFLAIIVAVSIMGVKVTSIFKEDSISLNKSSAQNAATQINLSMATYENSLEQLSRLIANQVSSGDSIKDIRKTIEAFQKNNGDLISVYYMNGKDGTLHASPEMEFNQDARETKTYTELTERPETKWMDVYKDTTSGTVMTSVVTPVLVDGKMAGALGYDIDLSTIGKMRSNIEKDSTSSLVILDSQGFIVSSFMKDMDGKNMNPEKSGMEEGVEDLIADTDRFDSEFKWVADMYNGETKANQSLTLGDEDFTGEVSAVPEVNWKVVALTPDKILQSKLDDMIKIVLISSILGLLFGTICALYLAGRLTKIMGDFKKVIEKTANGDLVTELAINSNDEIGDLSKSYNSMLGKLRGLVAKVNGNAESVTNANAGLSQIAAENSSAITDVSRAIDEIASGASNQSEQVEHGASTIQVLSNEIDGLSKQSRETQSVLELASEKIESGKQQVSGLETSYQKLELAFTAVTDMSLRLVEKSKTISDVTNAISKISEQTNLLSLNASIEAARAGESGKGFAVVANEVRSLADDSKEATKNIQVIIQSILSDTEELLKTTNETNQISKDQKNAVITVSEAMKELEDSVGRISNSIQEETRSIESINQQKETVVQVIEEITAVSQQTTASSEEIASSMEEQAASSNELAQYTRQLTQLINDLETTLGEFQIYK
ncbi:methyl-accepting chemotaxis protein [Peribacillus muralis]|uniref:methyl-accepting chemotaxis protein n=1 Tax=Peribacillus muralis TaxID=264697 RepID=UPI001F4F0116|nr:methyl-accepting chemotaxis protein [Peribacillus muralis]MCK1991987.1 methyl-accepting chemotaxis protein [Peribacillus muralis]MCK2012545.1 methyl-accepting chemotaxis protein [Peribacillus muralis]